MSTPQQELRERTKQFAYRVIRLFRSLPRTPEAQVIGKQLLRSATAVAANYRATNRSRSRADFVSKISIVLEEADETLFWLECLPDNKIIRPALWRTYALRPKNSCAFSLLLVKRRVLMGMRTKCKSPDHQIA